MIIIFENTDGSIGIVTPTKSALNKYDIESIAKTSVPSGLSYWIVEDDVVPTDRTSRDSWVMDTELEPDGVGSEYNTIAEVMAE